MAFSNCYITIFLSVNLMTNKKQTKTTSMLIATILLTGMMGFTIQSAHAVPSTIDFEGLCSAVIGAPIVTADNSVTLKVGTTLVGATDGFAVTVGGTQEAFLSTPVDTPHNADGTVYVEGGKCFYSDDVQGFNAGFNYYLSFANPVTTLSLDLYDYSDDGNFDIEFPVDCKGNAPCDGDVATLTVYDDLAQTSIVGTGTYTVDAANWFDGQVANLSVAPGASFVSASITFSNIDRGTGIDNITFDTVPPLEICEDDTMDLIAGQHIDSGDVTVVNDGTILLITIHTQDDWQLSESHIQIGETLDDFPLTKKGNPKVGNFDYQREYDPLVTEDTYEFLLADLGLESGDTITFAVHTVVVQTDLDGEIIAEETAWKQGERFVQKGNWAMYNTYDIQECDVIE